jgi:hypothetical protein
MNYIMFEMDGILMGSIQIVQRHENRLIQKWTSVSVIFIR